MKRRPHLGRRVCDYVAERMSGSQSSRGRMARGSMFRRRLRAEPLEQRCLLSVTTFADDSLAWDVGGDLDSDGMFSPGDLVVCAQGEAGETTGLVYGVNAFDSIQEAVNAADPGGTVVVAPGAYFESVAIGKDLTLTGSTGVASDVIITGDLLETVITLTNYDSITIKDLSAIDGNPNAILCGGDADSMTTLNNVTVASSLSAIEISAGSLLVSDCTLDANYGTGIMLLGGTVTVDQCYLFNNITVVEQHDGNVKMTNNTFAANDFVAAGLFMVPDFGATPKAMLEGNDFTALANFGSAVNAFGESGYIDLGQLGEGVDFTGLGVSSGGNDFSAYTPELLWPAVLAMLWDYGLEGPTGLPPAGQDVPAHGNTWFSTDPAEIETVIHHDPDEWNADVFVDYAVLSNLDLAVAENQVGEDVVTTLTVDFSNDPQTHTVLIDWGDGQTDEVVLAQGVMTVDVDHVYAGGGSGGGAPTLDDAAMSVEENSENGTLVGTLVATGSSGGGHTINVTVTDVSGGLLEESVETGSGGGGGPLAYSVIGGTGAAVFAVDPVTGEVTVADQTLLDYEAITSFTLEVQATDAGGSDTAVVTIDLINRASITGNVYVDVNENGLFDANEPTIDGVVIELLDEMGVPVLDAQGNPITATTEDGFYLFEDLVAGTYQIHEIQPSGVDDGTEMLGTLGGAIPANDTMQVTLAQTDAHDYIFAEIGQVVHDGDTASIGFWASRRGRNLIIEAGPALAQWLTDNFGNVTGNELIGGDGSDVYAFYLLELVRHRSIWSLLTAKVDMDFMALALATYFTTNDLGGSLGASYGFNATDTGIGTRIVNVGNSGEAFGVANDTDMTLMQLLLATNAMTDPSDNISGYTHVYDLDGDGRVDLGEAYLRVLADSVFRRILRDGN
ncbi:MAG: hypothetical protein JW719_00150 [Pirellulales bacterium]|nr:hypothetical protein [Pirellulales bacterium]